MNSPLPPDAPPLDGWEARFLGTSPRLEEVVECYQELGFEVLVVPFDPKQCEGCCQDCFTDTRNPIYVVYTRIPESQTE